MRDVPLFALLAATCLLGCEAADASPPESGSEPAPSRGGRVDGARAKQLVADGATLLDVRSPGEFADEHAPGARNIPVDALRARLAELDKSKPVVTYCAVGSRSRQAAAVLRDNGFTVWDMGSLGAWPK